MTDKICGCSHTDESLEENITIIADKNSSEAWCDLCGGKFKEDVKTLVVSDLVKDN